MVKRTETQQKIIRELEKSKGITAEKADKTTQSKIKHKEKLVQTDEVQLEKPFETQNEQITDNNSTNLQTNYNFPQRHYGGN